MLLQYLVFFQLLTLNWIRGVVGPLNQCDDTKCVNGQCQNGICECASCYKGPSCELMDNVSPIFEKSSYEFIILQAPIVGQVVGKVSAQDKDTAKCAAGSCHCSTIAYSILNDESNGMFTLDVTSGELVLSRDTIQLDYEYVIDIKAANESPFDNIYDTATIFVKYGPDNIIKPLLRPKRAATAPTTLSFALVQVYPATPINITKIGQKLSFQLTITFPVGLSSLTVELFGPEAATPVMMICNANVISTGSQVSGSAIPTPLQETMTNFTWPYTRVTYTISNQNNPQSSSANLADIQIVIGFDAYMLYYPTIPDATLYYVSAGAEYLNSTQIWVGQSGYTSSVTVAAPSPTITIVGDTAIYPGCTAAFDVVIYSPDYYIQLNMEFYSPLNDTTLISFCYINRYSMGASFSCIPPTYNQPSLTNITSNLVTYYPTGSMNLSWVTNQLKQDNTSTGTPKDTIKIKMALRTNPLAWPGGMGYVGIAASVTATNIQSVLQSLPIQVKGPKIPYTSPITIVLDYNGTNQAPMGSVTQLVINITVPNNTELDYTITASFQSLNTEICGFKWLFIGANIPCLNQVVLNPTFTSSTDGYQVMSTVVLPNIRSVPISALTTDDIIQVLVSFRPINDNRNTPGATINSNITVAWSGGFSPVLTNTFTLQAAPVLANVSNTNVPTFQFQILGSDGNISNMEARSMFFSMVLVPGIIYSPSTLEFYMPFNSTARMRICQAIITFVGANIICFNPTIIKSKFVYSSRINDTTTYDKLSIPIGSLCTAGPIGRTATNADSISIQLDFIVLIHSMNTPGALTTINAGMLLTANQIWVGNQNIKIVSNTSLPALTPPNIPTLTGSRVDSGTYVVWQNDVAIMQYIIKVAGSSSAQLTFTVTSDIGVTDNFGACSILIIKKGNSIPCLQTTLSNITWSPFSKFNKQLTMQFSTIINSGTTPISNPSFDANSILLEVPIKFGGSLPATFNVQAALTYNTGTIYLNTPFTLNTTFSRVNGTILANEPVFTYNLMPLFNTSTPNYTLIGYGEALRAIISIQLQPATIQTLSVSFASTAGTMNQMDIVSINVLSVGLNIPCLSTGIMKYFTTSRSGSQSWDLNTLNLGTVCRRDTVVNSSAADNTIIIEAVFRVWRMPLNSPSTVDINCLALVNNDEIFITRITINTAPSTTQIIETNLLNLNVSFNATLSTTSFTIGQNVSVNVTIRLPPFSQFSSSALKIYPIWPVGADSALIVSDNTNFTATFGQNVLFNPLEYLRMNSTSSMNTSQLDYISAFLGIAQNPGTTYRMGQENYTGSSVNDVITLQFNIRITDNMLASNGYAFTLIMGAEFGSQKVNQSFAVTASRSNAETLTIDGNATLISNNSIYTQSDQVQISVIAKILNGSQLECRNFSIYIASPSFMSLTSIMNSSYTCPGFTIQQSSLALGGISFNVPYFFMTDQISVTFGLTLNQSTTLTRQRQQSLTVIPIIFGCKTLNWSLNSLGNKYVNKATDVRFTLQGNQIVVGGCNNNLQVFNSTVIKDCSINAYLAPFPGSDALKVRSNSGSMWKPPVRGGYYDKYRYIDIVFGSLTTVTTVTITSTSPNLPTTIAIYGTMDGRSYSYYQTLSLLFTGTTASVALSTPSFNYYGIRISVTQTMLNDTETGLNIDLIGCATVNVTAPPIDPCPLSYTKPNTSITDYYGRGYLYVAPHLFVCDDLPVKSTYLETAPRCFRALDSSPNVWTDMGPYIGKVIGFDLNLKAVYGIGADLKSFVMSTDDGLTWTNINENGWKIIKANGQLGIVIVIPWIVSSNFAAGINGTACTKYSNGAWYFCYDGVYNSGTLQLAWNTCCSL